MAPPKTMAISQAQQQFSNGQQQAQNALVKNNNQQSAKVRNRKAKQQQQQNSPEKSVQVANGATPPNAASHQSIAHDNHDDNHGIQQQVEPKNQSVVNNNGLSTNGAKSSGSLISTTTSTATTNNSPAPSERTTMKQRKQSAQSTLESSPTSNIKQQNQDQHLNNINGKGAMQLRTTAQNNITSKIATSTVQQQNQDQQKQSAQHLDTHLTPSLIQQSQPTSQTVAQSAAALVTSNDNNQLISNKHQSLLAADEPDDIDAGIELDGSSNSGSSVKDASEDHMKSNSVSPVMSAQSTLVNVPTQVTKTSESNGSHHDDPQLAKVARCQAPKELVGTREIVESLPGAVVSAACSESVATPVAVRSTAVKATGVAQANNKSPTQHQINTKKTTMTREELAKEREVIEADEQLIREKLESKQRKSSGGSASSLVGSQQQNNGSNVESSDLPPGANATDANNKNSGHQNHAGDLAATAKAEPLKNDKSSARLKRQPSTNSNKSSQDIANGNGLKSLCKNCGQHVYQMERMLAEKSLYHKQCFKCHQCRIQLRIDNYASHEGQVYCKAHHKQIFQPKAKLNDDGDGDNLAKSTTKQVDEYLLQRGRLSELTFSFLNSVTEGSRQRQMIICENEPVELSKDVVRSDTKIDDGINNLKLNLNSILRKFENGDANNCKSDGENQGSSSGSPIIIEKPRFNIKQKLAAFENNQVMPQDDSSSDEQQQQDNSKTPNNNSVTEKPIVGKLGNVANFLTRFNSQDECNTTNENQRAPVRTVVKRSESLMGRLKKYESRIAGEKVEDDDNDSSSAEEDDKAKAETIKPQSASPKKIDIIQYERSIDPSSGVSSLVRKQSDRVNNVPKLSSIDLSSLKNRWENGDIKNVSHGRDDVDDDNEDKNNNSNHHDANRGGDDKINSNSNLNSPMAAEKQEELFLIRQQLAQRKSGKAGSVKNIYEKALREAEEQQKSQLASSRRDSSDLSALNGFSTSEIQQQLLQQKQQQIYNNNNLTSSASTASQPNTPTSNTKDHFQLNISRRANKLKERFELGLINNSLDDSDVSDSNDTPALSKLEQIRQEKMDDLSVFTDGEIKAREARSMFQQIDRRLSSSGQTGQKTKTKSFHNSRTTTTSVGT